MLASPANAGTLAGWEGLGIEGPVAVSFWMNDSFGRPSARFDIVLNRDTIGPIIRVSGLSPGQLCGLAAPSFVLTITEDHYFRTWYSLDAGITNTNCGLTGTLSVQWSSRGNGTVSATFWVEDVASRN